VIETDYGDTVFIRWDSITLKAMGLDVVLRCENESLDWYVMTLEMADVKKVATRDAGKDAVRAANRLKTEMIGDPRLEDG
jgi:hypothetical protein